MPAEQLVAVYFGASWCYSCKGINTLFEQIARKAGGGEGGDATTFVKVDVDDSEELAAQYEVVALPNFVFIRGGETVGGVVGAKQDLLEETFATLSNTGGGEGGGGGRSSSTIERGGSGEGWTATTGGSATGAIPAPSAEPAAKRFKLAEASSSSSSSSSQAELPDPELTRAAVEKARQDGGVRIFITGPASGSGKSTVSLALIVRLLLRNYCRNR